MQLQQQSRLTSAIDKIFVAAYGMARVKLGNISNLGFLFGLLGSVDLEMDGFGAIMAKKWHN